ncbi:hypothetical protein ES703_92924 [subsurface metagenome]
MKEKDLITLLNNNFNRDGWSYKIANQPRYSASSGQRFNIKKPFDGFSVMPGKIYFWEAKFLNGYRAFPLSSIRDHQLEALLKIDSLIDNMETYPMIILGVYLLRKGFNLFFFDISYIKLLQEKGAKSILKTELLEIKAEGKFLPLRKRQFEVNKVPEKIVYWT